MKTLAGICLRTYPAESLYYIYIVLSPCAPLLLPLSFQERVTQRWQGTNGSMALSHRTARQAGCIQETKIVSSIKNATENKGRGKKVICPSLLNNSRQLHNNNKKKKKINISISLANTKHL